MPTTFWTGNAAEVAQVNTITVTAVALNGTLTVTFNGKAIVYTCTALDTTSTAAAALQALIAASTAPPEFQEVTFAVATNVITCTSKVAGRPFTMTAVGAAGATMTHTTTTTSVGPSDVSLAANWLRSGVASLPQNGDDVSLSDSSVPLLWNLGALAAVQFASLKRYNSFTGTQIGLPINNPSGYREYRATYFAFTGPPAGTLLVSIGYGPGDGVSVLEQYDAGAQATAWNVSGSPNCRILNSSATSSYQINGAIVQIAMLPGETATCSGGVEVTNETIKLRLGLGFFCIPCGIDDPGGLFGPMRPVPDVRS